MRKIISVNPQNLHLLRFVKNSMQRGKQQTLGLEESSVPFNFHIISESATFFIVCMSRLDRDFVLIFTISDLSK
jgi:hypothetical protein